jgi:glycine cleavage system H protein
MTVLFVIATIIIFLTADWLVRRSREQRSAVKKIAVLSAPTTPPVRMPEGIFFSPSHTWLNLFPSGRIRLGVDDFIARLVEAPEIVLLRQPGEKIQKGDALMLLKEGEHSLTVRSPLTGEILDVNRELAHNPAWLKERLFSDGWGYTIKPQELSEVKHMLIGNETIQWMRNEFQRLRDLLAGLSTNGSLKPALLQDGGPPVGGVLRTMDDAVWQRLDSEFLEIQ